MTNSAFYKAVVSISALALMAVAANADNYRILMVNTNEINIGNQTLTTGDTFSDTEVIKWSTEMQAVKVLNLTTHKTMIIAAKQLKTNNCNNLLDYVVFTKQMSVRNDVKSYSGSEQYLLDTIKVSSPIDPVHIERLELLYIHIGKKISKPLKCDQDGLIIIPRSLFSTNRQSTVKVNIFCKMKDDPETICLIKDMIIYLL